MKKRNKKNSNFKKCCVNFLKRNYVYIIMVGLAILRIWLGHAIGAWYGISETYDDVAMMQGLSLKRLTNPNNLALIKDLSFSLFLGFTAITNLPYTVVLSGFWVLTAFVVWLLVKKLTDKKWAQLLAFFYVLFLPIAFTPWGGLRIYRNAIIAPCIILTFSLALILLVDLIRKEKLKKVIWAAVFTGISFAFTYFLKEDGIWLKVCMIVFLVIYLAIIGFRLVKKKVEMKKAIVWALVCLIPFGVFFVWDNVYRGVNYAAFGVYEINTRTEGELGEFVENVYKIDSPNRTQMVWAPYDAIEAVFKASPTLGAHPELLEEIMTTSWNEGGIVKNPIKYDFLGWVMRSELADSGLWTSEKEVNDMFRKVNDELAEAFSNGSLKKAEGRIQLLASTGGYTLDEITGSDLLEQVAKSLRNSIWFEDYEIGFSADDVSYGTKDKEWDYTKANKVLHMEDDVNVVEGREAPKNIVSVILVFYRIVNILLILLTAVLLVWQLIKFVRSKNKKKYIKENKLVICCAATSLIFWGVTIVYSLATAWFFIALSGAGYYSKVFIFYRVGVPALLTLALMPIVVMVAEGVDWQRCRECLKRLKKTR